MNVLEILLSKRWILKKKDKALYYEVKDNIGTVKKFLNEKLGYHIIVNNHLIKVEKTPHKLEEWMGITEFQDKIEYIFLCMILMFLEDKEVEEQFVLSQLTEYIQTQYAEEQIDWTLYRYRRYLIKTIKFCIQNGLILINDGNEENFMKDMSGEVLYENTGISRYFMKHFTQDIANYEKDIDFLKDEWIDVNEDRGAVRRQRVYRNLLMAPALYRTNESEEDYIYVRNYRNVIQGDLEELLDCELHVHKSSSYLVLGEECRLGRTFPESNSLSDILLLLFEKINIFIREKENIITKNEEIKLSEDIFKKLVEQCKNEYGEGFIKEYREMTTGEFYYKIKEYMQQLDWIEQMENNIKIKPIIGKVVGKYPDDFTIGDRNDTSVESK